MSAYGTQVVAVLETQSTFGTTISNLVANVTAIQTQMNTLLADAPETLDTLNEIAAAISDDPAFFSTMASANTTLQNNIDALATAAATARTALETAIQTTITAEALTATNGRAALSTRLDALELDPVSKAYVDSAVTTLIDSAPAALDTLNELAAALGDDANFATTITNSIATLQTDVNQNEADADAAISAVSSDLTTEIAARGTADAALNTLVDSNKNLTDAAIALKFDKAGGTITGNLAVAKNWPDVELKSGDEKRILFSDAGGGSTAAIKHVSTTLDFYAGGIAGGNKEMSIGTDGVDVSALKIDGTAVSATAAEINAFDSRLDTLEADPTTATALAAVQADVDQNESDADNAIALANVAMLAAVATVQADVDANESDADTAIALKADTAGDTFTGDILLKNPSGNAVSLRLSRADHPDMSCEWKITPSYVSSTKECLSVLAAGQPVAHFDERQRVSINKTDPGYTLDVAGDGKFSTDLTIGNDLTISGDITHNGDRLYFNVGSQLIRLKDNQASALKIENGDGSTLDFLDFKTTNSSELLTFGAPNLFNGTVSMAGLTDAANDSAAATAGVAVNQLYRNGSVVMIRVS